MFWIIGMISFDENKNNREQVMVKLIVVKAKSSIITVKLKSVMEY